VCVYPWIASALFHRRHPPRTATALNQPCKLQPQTSTAQPPGGAGTRVRDKAPLELLARSLFLSSASDKQACLHVSASHPWVAGRAISQPSPASQPTQSRQGGARLLPASASSTTGRQMHAWFRDWRYSRPRAPNQVRVAGWAGCSGKLEQAWTSGFLETLSQLAGRQGVGILASRME
jgi:hypothetical protein